jgi:hypothetical protein
MAMEDAWYGLSVVDRSEESLGRRPVSSVHRQIQKSYDF